MAVYIVTWNLNKEGAAYSRARANLIAAIDALENTYSPSLESVRFISTTKTANELYTHLCEKGKLDGNDMIVAVRMHGKGNNSYNDGNLGQGLWDWINARI
jgi:hypothetical protein